MPVGELDAIQNSLTVRLIETKREAFSTCRLGELVAAVVSRNSEDRFDFIPVAEQSPADDAPIVGVIEISAYHDRLAPETMVRELRFPLTEGRLIGADASILTFIRDAEHHPFRFVVSGQRISGLVTRSDLQRLPVRAVLFTLVTQLEIKMAEFIRRRWPERQAWIDLISCRRREKVAEKIRRLGATEGLVDALLFTDFCDKRDIIEASWPPRSGTSLSRSTFSRDLHNIEELRNALAHANDYAIGHAQEIQVCERVRQMDVWIDVLSEQPD